MLKKIAVTAAVTLSAAIASTAAAQVAKVARVVEVEPAYAVETIVDITERCETVREPVYANSTTTTVEGNGDVLGGALLGAIIGGIATDSGEGAAVGGLLGGLIASENGGTVQTQREVIGHRNKWVCRNVETPREVSRVVGYDVTFRWAGIQSTAFMDEAPRVGDSFPIFVSITPR